MITPTPSPRRRSSTAAIGLILVALSGALPVRSSEAGLNRWTSSGPDGDVIRALAPASATSGVVFAATSDGRVFKSATSGSFWTPLGVVSPSAAVSAVVADPTNDALLYAATRGQGVFKSTDSGRTWIPSSSGLGNQTVGVLAIDPKTPTILYAGTEGGLFRSNDAGGSWTPKNIGLTGTTVEAIIINPQTPSNLFVSMRMARVFRTDNSGEVWFSSSTGMQVANVNALAIDPKAPATLYAGTTSSVFKSVNGGVGWGPSGGGLPGGGVPALAVDPQTPATLYSVTGNTLFRSTNGGALWGSRASGLPSTFSSGGAVVAIDPAVPATLYTGTAATGSAELSSGVFRSTDGGGNWTRSNAGIAQAASQALALDPQAPATLYGGTLNGVFKSVNGGASWASSNAGLTTPVNVLAIDPQNPQTLYAGANAGVFKSTNGGAGWGAAGLPASGQAGSATTALAVNPQSPSTLYAATCIANPGLADVCQLFRSTNGGSGFTDISPGIPSLGVPGGNRVGGLAVDPQTPANVYAATTTGVFKSTNSGAGWSASNAGITGIPNRLVVDPATPSVVYAGTESGGVFRSTSGGASWAPRNSGLSNLFIRALAIDPNNPAVLYAGTAGGGVFKTSDGGASWAPENAGLGNPFVSALAVSPSGTCVHAATQAGVFDFATQPTADCPTPPALAASFSSTGQSIAVGQSAQTIATVRNLSGTTPDVAPDSAAREPGDETVPLVATGCGITQVTGAGTPFAFQALDPATNQPLPGGSVNAPIDIAPGSTAKFMITLTAPDPVCALDIQFGFNCTNTSLADILTGVNTFQLTAGNPAAATCGLSASASVSQTTFTVGQTLTAGGSVTNPGLPDTAADFYVGILRPDGSIQFLTPSGLVVGNVANLGSFRPLATNVPLAAPFTTSQPSVLTQQLAASDQRGAYVFFVIAVKTGALAGGAVNNDQILRIATAPYTFP